MPIRGILAATLLTTAVFLTGPAWALGGGREPARPFLGEEARRDWGPLLEQASRDGVPAESFERVVAGLEAAGRSPGESRPLLEPAFEAARSGLPSEPILAKLAEGSLKGAPPEDLAEAARLRLGALQQARGLLAQRGYPETGYRGRDLLISTALALESGVPGPALAVALDRGAGLPPGHVTTLVEAGEALHLAGLDPDTVAGLLADCLDRNLRRPEILRVVNFARERHRAGHDGAQLRAALWGGAGPTGASGGGSGPMGPGSGPGGPPGDGGMGPRGPGGMGGRTPRQAHP